MGLQHFRTHALGNLQTQMHRLQWELGWWLRERCAADITAGAHIKVINDRVANFARPC